MDVAFISAVSALGGSVIGGTISGLATWLSQRVVAHAGQRTHDKSRLEDLYRDFIDLASKLHGNALTSNDPQIQEIVALYALVNRMRILSSPQMVACADKIMYQMLDTYFAPSITVQELHELMKNGGALALDALKDFSETAREELRSF